MKRLVIAIPVPFGVDPNDVIKGLHNHENILNNNPLFQNWEKSEQKWDSSAANSMFFTGRSCTDHPDEPVPYSVVQRVERAVLLGRWHSSTAKSPALLQNLDKGARGEVKLPQNVILWSEWIVQRNLAENGWEILDITRVDGSDRSIASVRKTVTTAHLNLMKAVLRIVGVKDSDVGKIEVKWSEQERDNWMGIGFA
jgi:hypothetical protein